MLCSVLLWLSWWRHQMETFSALLALCAGNSPVPVNSPHKGQWRGALMFSLICARINDWVNNRDAGDLRRHRGHNDVIVMIMSIAGFIWSLYPYSIDFSAAFMRRLTGWALVHGMACRLSGAKPLPESLLTYCQLEPWEQISVKFELKCKIFVHENAFENVVCEMVATLSRGKWDNWHCRNSVSVK